MALGVAAASHPCGNRPHTRLHRRTAATPPRRRHTSSASAASAATIASAPAQAMQALPVHERNSAVHEEIKDVTLQEVRAWADRTFPALIEQLELLPEEAYADATYFERMPVEWVPWKVIAGNTFKHYPEHLAAIRALAESD